MATFAEEAEAEFAPRPGLTLTLDEDEQQVTLAVVKPDPPHTDGKKRRAAITNFMGEPLSPSHKHKKKSAGEGKDGGGEGASGAADTGRCLLLSAPLIAASSTTSCKRPEHRSPSPSPEPEAHRI